MFLVTASHIVQKTAASHRFEFGFHYVCFKSNSFDAIPEICRSVDFPIYILNLNINLDFVWVAVRHIVEQTAASNSFECGFHDVCSKSNSFDAFPQIDRSPDFPSFLLWLEYKSSFCFSDCKPHRSTNSRIKAFRVWVPWCLLKVNFILCISWNWQVFQFS